MQFTLFLKVEIIMTVLIKILILLQFIAACDENLSYTFSDVKIDDYDTFFQNQILKFEKNFQFL